MPQRDSPDDPQSCGKVNGLYYRVLYRQPPVRYHMPEIRAWLIAKGGIQMDRCIITMRHKHLGFRLCSFTDKLRIASLCPDRTHGKDPGHRMP